MNYMGIAVALRNHLVSRPEIQALVTSGKIAKDSNMTEGYIFSEVPYAVVDKLNNSTIVVVSTHDTWDAPNKGSNFEYPRVYVDIWSAPKKSSSGDLEERNADDNIREVFSVIKPFVNLVNSASSPNSWDGVKVVSSEILEGPDYKDVSNAEWHRMARITLGVIH